MKVASALDFLVGSWSVERTLEDHRTATTGVFSGTAQLVATDALSGRVERASYEESGVLRFGSYLGRAHRGLRLTRQPDGSVLVGFCDGRPFVDLDLGTGAWQSTHLCVADRYEISTFVYSSEVVEERWKVRGPETEYDAVTFLRRLAA